MRGRRGGNIDGIDGVDLGNMAWDLELYIVFN